MYRCRMTLRVLITLTAVLALCASFALAKEEAANAPTSLQPLQIGPDFDIKDEVGQDQGTTEYPHYEGEAIKVGPHRQGGQPIRGRTYSSVYLSEDFEGSVPPAGWSSIVTNANDPEFTWNAYTGNAYSGVQSTDVEYDPDLVPQDEWLITPSMDLSAATSDLRVDFYWFQSYYWGVSPFDNYDIELWVSTDGGSTFPTKVWDEHDFGVFENYVFNNVIVDLSAYAGQSSVALGFRYVGSDGAQAALDLVTVTDDPPPLGRCCFADQTCQDLSELDCTNAGGVSWDEGLNCTDDPCPVIGQGDDCSNPLLINLPSELPYLDKDQTTCGRTDDYDATCLGFYDGGEDIIYKVSVASEVTVDITLDPKGETYTGIAIDDACPLDGGTCIASATQGFSGGAPYGLSSVTLAPGDYWIMVDTWPSPDCLADFDLTIEEATPLPPGANCADPYELNLGLADLPYTETGLATCGFIDDYDGTCLGLYDGGEDFIFAFTPSEDMVVDITVDANGDNYYGFAIDDVCPLSSGSTDCIAEATSSSSSDPQSVYCVTLVAGTTYYIMVDTWPSPDCLPNFDITIEEAGDPPANDLCADATPIGEVTNLAYTTVCANNDGPGGYIASPNVWFAYTPSTSGNAVVSLCGSSYDTRVRVWEGTACPPTVVIAEDDDACESPTSLASEVCFTAVAGETYLVEVGGYSSDFGDGVITTYSNPAPPNQYCADVTPVTLTSGVPVTFNGDNSFACNECPSFPGGHVWEAFEITECSNVTLDYCGTSPAFGNAWLNLAYDCPCTDFTAAGVFNVADCGDGNVTIRWDNLPAGTYYYPVLNDPANNAVGPYTINVVAEAATEYCPADGGGDEYIGQVEFVTINNSTGSDNYADYTDQSTPIVKGESYDLTVTNGNPYLSDQCGVWIDWNQDFCFDLDEEVGVISGGGPYVFSVVAPPGALEGEATMRIRITYTGVVAACGSTTYGEVEDYTVEVRNNEPTVLLSPDPQFIYYLFAIVPLTNEFHAGMFDGGYTAADVDLTSLTVNGNALGSPSVLSGIPGFVGDVVYGSLPTQTFLADYSTTHVGTLAETFTLEGNYTDMTPFSIVGEFDLAGKMPGPFNRYIEPYVPGTVFLPGDFDLTGGITISDAVAIISYIFGGGPSPENVMIGDADCSETVAITDAVYLISYIFGGGAEPCNSQ